MIRSLTHAAVRATDLERSVAFYRDVLGLAEHFRLKGEDGRTFLVYMKIADGQFIELFPGGSGVSSNQPTSGIVHLCFEVDNIHEAYRRLTHRGIASLYGEPVLAADHTWQFWIADPDGTPIEFHQFTDRSMQHTGGATGHPHQGDEWLHG
jgi:lactoylglutathione lyase